MSLRSIAQFAFGYRLKNIFFSYRQRISKIFSIVYKRAFFFLFVKMWIHLITRFPFVQTGLPYLEKLNMYLGCKLPNDCIGLWCVIKILLFV